MLKTGWYQIIETGELLWIYSTRSDRFTYYSIEYESFTDVTSIQYELISIYQIQFLKLIKELQK